MDEQRSPQARALAERALVRLLHELGAATAEMVVLGGLVPEILTQGQDPPAPPHLGTTDVDVLLITQIEAGVDLQPVESALKRIDFHPVDGGWRWRGRVSGHMVKIEFLCDLDGAREHESFRPAGCHNLAARNLRGTGYVARDWTPQTLSAELSDGTTVSVEVRFARLGGYLLSKCVSARTRGAEKDFYDLAYVLLHNRAGGPRQAAQAVLAGRFGDAILHLRTTFSEIRERYWAPNAVGPTCFATQTLLIEPEADETELRAEAVTAVKEFIGPLLAAGEPN